MILSPSLLSADFSRLATIFLQEDVTGQVKQVEIGAQILNHRLGIRNDTP